MAAAGAVALSGCGSGTQTVGTAPPKQKDPFEQRAEQIVRDWPKVSPVSGRKDTMLPLTGADRPRNTAVRELTVTVGHGACDAKYGVHTHESKDLVVVAGWSKKKNQNGMCTSQLVTDKVEITLKSPLDDRELVDAATGKQLLKG
ncbi:hypothetical protein K9S39_32985 [Streptomyces halobius]|uniref:Lipoprotein n=2 Tax=Streptomyces halobius TaxID=2879846 RepID=A0ABY4MLH8_9ACTN|nr:hypothetical protein K9S39_32985 [Streptomyces halobius]